MKNLNNIVGALIASFIVSGCSSTPTCPFGAPNNDGEPVTITAYLPPVVTDLDYKDIKGAKNQQVVVLGGFQHAVSISVREPVIHHGVPHTLKTFELYPEKDAGIPDDETIYFKFDQASIPVYEQDKLNRFLQRINSPDLIHVHVEGHTDANGSTKYNNRLSIKRAQTVRDYLVQYGIQGSKISFKGFGEGSPLEVNDTEEHRSKNRRAEIIPLIGH